MTTTTEKTAQSMVINFDPRPLRKLVRRVRRDQGRRAFFGSDRRARRRLPVRRPIYVTPVMVDGTTLRIPQAASSHTIGHTMDVSIRGIGFTHDEPLLTKHLIVTFDLLEGDPVSLLIQIQWSRFRADHWYSSGGKFIAVVETPAFLCCTPGRASASLN